jgi:hypothetical protein
MTLSASWEGTAKDQVTVRTTYGPVTNLVTEDRGHVASFWNELGRLLAQHPEHREAMAKGGYQRYAQHAGYVSVRGEELPEWDDAKEDVREHWRAIYG